MVSPPSGGLINIWDQCATPDPACPAWGLAARDVLGADKGPYTLTPNTIELIPTLGALFSRGGPVQDPVLTGYLAPGMPRQSFKKGHQKSISPQGSRLQKRKQAQVPVLVEFTPSDRERVLY